LIAKIVKKVKLFSFLLKKVIVIVLTVYSKDISKHRIRVIEDLTLSLRNTPVPVINIL
jgi:hypothetical protein